MAELKYDDNGTAREIVDIGTKLEGGCHPRFSIVGEVLEERQGW